MHTVTEVGRPGKGERLMAHLTETTHHATLRDIARSYSALGWPIRVGVDMPDGVTHNIYRITGPQTIRKVWSSANANAYWNAWRESTEGTDELESHYGNS
jgi:hypothetical protein